MKKARVDNSEIRFYEVLKNIFIGAKVEGISGYINLMKIKSKYFEKIFEILQKEIEEKVREFPEFKEELYEKLYSFFKRYFSESGSIYFVSTPYSERIYERVYTDKKDVSIFWKTHMLYYVKSDRIYNSMSIEVGGFKFFFDVSKLEHKKAWEKKELIYEFKEVKSDGTISFYVLYSERGRITKIDEIQKKLREKGIVVDEEILREAFSLFEKQSEVDYFINKNARQFLKEQFDLWLYQYVYSDESQFTEKRIKQLKVLKDIAYKIIDFISQFEDELVKIWNKPKFVLNSNYVITLDRIAKKENGLKIIEKIIKHKNFDEQIKEWKELEIVDDNFNKNEILEGNILNPKYQFLPIDTKYFKDLEPEIIGLFDNLDKELDGWLIKSENYQALITILPKFKGKVQTIYIDPPFNKEQDADYFYKVKFKDSTWITMLENRLTLAKELLKDTGSIFVRCDYNGNMYVRLLMNEIFGEENFRNEIIIRKGNVQTGLPSRFNPATESLFFYAKNLSKIVFKPIFEEKKRELKWIKMLSPKDNPIKNWCFVNGEKFIAPKGYHWNQKQEKIDKLYEEGKIIAVRLDGSIISKLSEEEIKKLNIKLERGMIYKLESEERAIDSNWTDIHSYSNITTNISIYFPTENSEILLMRVIQSTSNETDLIMDFFLGSGTTTAVAHKLKRKWIGVEMGEHFYTVVLPRMKKVLAYDKSGISKEKDVKEKYNEKNAGGFFKYFELEQFEQTLRKVKYESDDPFLMPGEDPYNQYIFMRDPKLLDALEIDYQNKKVKVDLSKLYDNIDIAETLSCVLGKMIKRIKNEEVEFEDGTKISIKDLDYRLVKPLIWW
jgi:adenine specific DNA methylase Mod